MPYQAMIYKVLVSTPNDIVTELDTVKKAIDAWNATNSITTSKYLSAINWKTHSYPEVGDSPQKIINKQIVDDADIIIALFWTRIGTKTEDYASGTVEEIEESIKAGKKVLIYFSNKPVLPRNVDLLQFQKVKDYMGNIRKRTLYYEYSDEHDLYEKVVRHIGQIINSINDVDSTSEEKRGLIDFFNSFSQFYRKSLIDLSSEESSEPINLDNAKWIIKNITDQLIEYQSRISKDVDGELTRNFNEAVKVGKQIQQHTLYMDGGQSYKEFWEMGKRIIDNTRKIMEVIETEIKET
jgi:hypothetical protein